MLLFSLLVCWLVAQGRADPSCTQSAKVHMSPGFLPAALSAIKPLGFGHCNESTGTCLTPPAKCPDSSCCFKGIRRGSCGCAGERLGTELEDTACTDPKAFRFAYSACDDTGARHSAQLQLYALPASEECQDRPTVQVTNENGKRHIHGNFSLCAAVNVALKDANVAFPSRNSREVLPDVNIKGDALGVKFQYTWS